MPWNVPAAQYGSTSGRCWLRGCRPCGRILPGARPVRMWSRRCSEGSDNKLSRLANQLLSTVPLPSRSVSVGFSKWALTRRLQRRLWWASLLEFGCWNGIRQRAQLRASRFLRPQSRYSKCKPRSVQVGKKVTRGRRCRSSVRPLFIPFPAMSGTGIPAPPRQPLMTRITLR